MNLFFFRRKNYRSPVIDPDEIFADSMGVSGSLHSSDGKIEQSIGKFSSVIFLALAAAGIFYLVSMAGFLQITRGRENYAKSQENRFLTKPVLPARGIIYDRFRKPLVENYPSFGIAFEKDEFVKNNGNLKVLLETLSSVLNKPRSYFYEAGFPENNNPEELPRGVVIARGIGPEAIVAVASELYAVPGIQFFEDFRRIYGESAAFSHVLGFVGKVSEKDLAKHRNLLRLDTIGKSGIELQYDEVMRGTAGKKIVEIDASGKETRFKLVQNPRAGKSLTLTIDGDLQKYAYEMFSHYVEGKKGASAVIIDPRNGAIRALVSYPGFDSNKFGASLGEKEFEAILNNPLKPLFNRAIAGEFPSGSTIKPVIAAAALEEKIIDPNKKIYDEGFIEIPNPYRPGESARFVDWRKQGWIDFYDAIAVSANVYFYMIGGGYREQKGLGIERIKRYANAFGLGTALGIDIPGEKPGVIPDPEWKKVTDSGNPIWRIGDTYNASIGQGGVKVTPLQMAAVTGAIANGGKLYRPHILDSMRNEDGTETKREHNLIREGMASKEVLKEVVRGMRQAVTNGTAHLFSEVAVPVAAKTGTAQTGSGLPHAWIVAFAPVENPQIAIAVMVERAGEGSAVALPIAKDILKWYFETPNRN